MSVGERSREHPEVCLIGLVIVVDNVSAVVFLERKFALIISWAGHCSWNELKERLDFLLFFKGSLGDYAKPVPYFAVLAACTCWTSEQVVGCVIGT